VNNHLAAFAFVSVLTLGPGAEAVTMPSPGTGIQVSASCRDGRLLDPNQVWKPVKEKGEAVEFVKKQFAILGGLDNFVNWLLCQNFKVSLLAGPRTSLKAGELHIEATLGVTKLKLELLWTRGWVNDYFFPVWAHIIDVTLRSDGTVVSVDVVDIVK
jgi:hypothetical protein